MSDVPRSPTTSAVLTGLFAVTVFLSAFLFLAIQPVVAKAALPTLGGSPTVWTISVLFFQTALVGGYAYAHFVATLRPPLRPLLAYAGLLAFGCAGATFGPGLRAIGAGSGGQNASLQVFLALCAAVGAPVFALGATAPLTQVWFNRALGRAPYPLYSASNAGSLAALAAYPFWIERYISVGRQFDLWLIGTLALAVLGLVCAIAGALADSRPEARLDDSPRTPPRDWLVWCGLACVPSVLSLGVTAHVTTDLAAVPLLWVVPLGLYLFTFIIAFSDSGAWAVGAARRATPVLVAFTAVVLGAGLVRIVWLPLHLLTLFACALVVHGELADRKPSPSRLTGYFLAVAVGGAAGGFFNAVIAPAVFDRIVEYPLALVASAAILAFRGGRASSGEWRARSLAVPFVAGLAAAALTSNVWGASEGLLGPPLTALAAGLAILSLAQAGRRPLRFAATVGALLLAGGLATGLNGRTLFRERNAFGVLTVTEADGAGDHRLFHGSTLHGQQARRPDRRREPLTYFTRTGPIGQVFEMLRGGRTDDPLLVGVTGVGVGTLAAYAGTGDAWDFFEIDPAVVRVAFDPRFFTYLTDCRAARLTVKAGDARLTLAGVPDATYDVLFLDAFASDAIPVHLLTREAVALYRRKLRRDGRLVFNLTNRYLDLGPVIGALAADAGWPCLLRVDAEVSSDEKATGKQGSIWAVMAPTLAGLGPLKDDPRWAPPIGRPGAPPWTDDFSPVFDHLRPIGAAWLGPRRAASE